MLDEGPDALGIVLREGAGPLTKAQRVFRRKKTRPPTTPFADHSASPADHEGYHADNKCEAQYRYSKQQIR